MPNRWRHRRNSARAQVCAFVLLLGLLTSCCFGETSKYATWDKFNYNFQLPIKAVNPSSELVIFVNHSYPDTLHEVQITGQSDVLTVTRQPAVLPILEPTEIVPISLALQRTDKAQGETATLRLTFHAKELIEAKSIEVTVPLTAAAEQALHQQMAVPVGTMEVQVGGFGNQVYLLYLLPMILVLAWWLWRRRRLARI